MPQSLSEDNGLSILTDEHLRVYSIGISTGGVAEMRMAKANPKRQVIATTIDAKGAKFAQRHIEEQRLSKQVIVKVEDISQPLPYKDGSFDFVYARLVLHYLTKQQLSKALDEICRILKSGGKLFVVVRSTKCHEASGKNTTYDLSTELTTYTSSEGLSYSRYFHTEESIQEYLRAAGFSIDYTRSYEEQLYRDFQRTKLASHIDSLIEVSATTVDF